MLFARTSLMKVNTDETGNKNGGRMIKTTEA
jgi:hypothetical protein